MSAVAGRLKSMRLQEELVRPLFVECLSNSAMPYQVASMRHEESSWLLISAWCSFSALSMHSSLVLDTGLALPCPAV